MALSVGLGWSIAFLGMWLERGTMRAEMRIVDLPVTAGSDTPYIVLLRSFGDESEAVYGRPWPRGNIYSTLVPRKRHPLEDVLGWQCWFAGPLVTVADPRGGHVATAGASHRLVPQGVDWQDHVRTLLAGASLVLVIDGETPGLRWEVDQVLGEERTARKTLFVRAPDVPQDTFLADIGCTTPLPDRPELRQERVLAALKGDDGWAVLTSNASEDVDYEECVEWALIRTRTLSPFTDVLAKAGKARAAEQLRGQFGE